MRNTVFLLLTTGAAALLAACNPGVEAGFTEPRNLVAVSSFLSPQDSILTVYLYRGQPLGRVVPPTEAAEKTATVEISDGEKTVALAYQPARFRYERPAADLGIFAGKTYFIKVKTADGITLTSRCVVPSAASGLRVEGAMQHQDFEFEAHWVAPPDSPFALLFFSTPQEANSQRPLSYGSVRLDVPGSRFVIGSWMTDRQRGGANTIAGRVLSAGQATSVSLKMEVLNLDEPLHRYTTDHRDLATWNNNTDGFIPTFREPKAIYSNVEGGIGIFAAYNRSVAVVKIK